MMMGLAMHAPLLFWQPDFAKMFGIENIAPAEEWINIIGRYINNWRMPLFFLQFYSCLNQSMPSYPNYLENASNP